MKFGTKYGTCGTLRPRKPDEYPNITKEQWDQVYQFHDQDIDDELVQSVVVACILAAIVAGVMIWWWL